VTIAEQEELKLLRKLARFAGHTDYRCAVACWCGVNDLLDKLGMDRVIPQDPGDVPLDEGLVPIGEDPFSAEAEFWDSDE